MQVREGMSPTSLTVGPGHTLREAARLMHERGVGSAIVLDPDQPGPGLLTERDLLAAIGRGLDRATSSSPTRSGRWSRRPARWCGAAFAT
jgi:CBS domain-containing protein